MHEMVRNFTCCSSRCDACGPEQMNESFSYDDQKSSVSRILVLLAVRRLTRPKVYTVSRSFILGVRRLMRPKVYTVSRSFILAVRRLMRPKVYTVSRTFILAVRRLTRPKVYCLA